MGRWSLNPVRARDPHEAGRSATPLELFFDLVFVVGVAFASQNLHHFESEDHFSTGIIRYLMVFFAIWWAWMNFTWYASEFGTDDWLYRILTMTQMAGALVLAAGIPSAMNDLDFSVVVVGYVIMRLAAVCQWLRVARDAPEHRSAALRYAAGIAVVQALWVGFAFVPHSWGFPVFVALALCELAVPLTAERDTANTWHAHHIAERYGLFTIIVLGESILVSATSVVHAIEEATHYGALILLAITGFTIVACMWWIYFAREQGDELTSSRKAFLWGYGHYAIFASAAAVSAGIEVAIDYDTHHTGIDAAQAAAALCVPVAVFVFVVWLLLVRPLAGRMVNLVMPIVAVATTLTVFVPYSLQVVAVLLVALVVAMCREPEEPLRPGVANGH